MTSLKFSYWPSQCSSRAASKVNWFNFLVNLALPTSPLIFNPAFWWTNWHLGEYFTLFMRKNAWTEVCRMSSMSPGTSPYILINVIFANPITNVANSLSCFWVFKGSNSGARSPSVSTTKTKLQFVLCWKSSSKERSCMNAPRVHLPALTLNCKPNAVFSMVDLPVLWRPRTDSTKIFGLWSIFTASFNTALTHLSGTWAASPSMSSKGYPSIKSSAAIFGRWYE